MAGQVAEHAPAPAETPWRWVFATTTAVVIGAVAIFGIYTWEWRGGGDGEATRAHAYASAVMDSCTAQLVAGGNKRQDCRVENLERVGDGLWRVRYSVGLHGDYGLSRTSRCATIDLGFFRTQGFRGVTYAC